MLHQYIMSGFDRGFSDFWVFSKTISIVKVKSKSSTNTCPPFVWETKCRNARLTENSWSSPPPPLSEGPEPLSDEDPPSTSCCRSASDHDIESLDQ